MQNKQQQKLKKSSQTHITNFAKRLQKLGVDSQTALLNLLAQTPPISQWVGPVELRDGPQGVQGVLKENNMKTKKQWCFDCLHGKVGDSDQYFLPSFVFQTKRITFVCQQSYVFVKCYDIIYAHFQLLRRRPGRQVQDDAMNLNMYRIGKRTLETVINDSRRTTL